MKQEYYNSFEYCRNSGENNIYSFATQINGNMISLITKNPKSEIIKTIDFSDKKTIIASKLLGLNKNDLCIK